MDSHVIDSHEHVREVAMLADERDTALAEAERLADALVQARAERHVLWQLCKQQTRQVRYEKHLRRVVRGELDAALTVIGSYHRSDPDYADGAAEDPPAGLEAAACALLSRGEIAHPHDRETEQIAETIADLLQHAGCRIDSVGRDDTATGTTERWYVRAVADGGHGRARTSTVHINTHTRHTAGW